MAQTFRSRLGNGGPLVGTFVKTPTPHMVELAGLVGFDFVVLDAEHAPFTVGDLDIGILAGRARDIPVLVRLPAGSTIFVQQALDLGAAGIIVPHIHSQPAAAAAVASSRFENGSRGYSNSPRFGDYGSTMMRDLLASADRDAAVILQIEDVAGVDAVDQIAATRGVDALFIGRADLAVAYRENDPTSPAVDKLAERIVSAAKRAGIAVGTFYPDPAAYAAARRDTIDMLILGSDQSVLRSGWSTALSDVRAIDRQELSA